MITNQPTLKGFTMTINARPKNQKSASDFLAAWNSINATLTALLDADDLIKSSVTHGRNHQHLDGIVAAQDARLADRKFVHEHLEAARSALNAVKTAIWQATPNGASLPYIKE